MKVLKLACAAMLIAAPAFAATTSYECTFDRIRKGDWLPKTLFIAHEDGTSNATVMDPIIHQYNDGQPMRARVATNNSRRITFAWRVKAKSRTNQHAQLSYRATYLRGSSEMTISGLPLGYENVFSSKGRCTVKPIRK